MESGKGTKLGILPLILVVLLEIREVWSDGAIIGGGIPKHFYGDFFSRERGLEYNTKIFVDGLENEIFIGKFQAFKILPNTMDGEGNYHAQILFFDQNSDCLKCWELYYRTANIVQYKTSSCTSQSGGGSSLNETIEIICGEILPQTGLGTMFKTTLENTNCKTTFEGIYHFTYEDDYGGGGICNSPMSYIIACQEPGSPYVDNQVFTMNWGKCADVLSSERKDLQFLCMGSWRDENGNVFAAIADREEEVPRDRFKCLLTRYDQQVLDNKRRWTMSRWSECDTLRSPYDGDIRLEMQPVVYGTQLVEPTCNLPRNFTGTWFTSGEFDTDVTINNTHIYFKTKIDQYTFRETYFTCQQNRDSRYLMTAVTVGKCEVDFICFDFLPRHHNIIRWRMGKPYRATDPEERSEANFLDKKFRQACSWSSFTIDRTDTDWKYQTFLLNPPAPVDCPLGGRYRFVQIGAPGEHYVTRIRGITERPRHEIGCREQTTEFKSCMDNSKKIFVDAEYCNTVDHTGRPIGEYDEPDRELNCVGFWMEDMRSYMITYDEEDAVNKFRCWVYERLDWRNMVLSRSTRSMCGRDQTARSYKPEQGASLSLELYETERLWDDCPQRFNDGRNPFFSETSVYVLGEKGSESWRQSSYQWGSTGYRNSPKFSLVILLSLLGLSLRLVH